MKTDYDIIVVGAGHAGCEASVASARLGASVLLITMDMNKIAQMSCNPSIGGIAKGQIVREIDALGGFTGIVTDASSIQFRMLNKSKGPAVWSPRAQCDRMFFSLNWRYILENTCNLDIWQDSVVAITLSESNISGVTTSMGATFMAKSVIITAGTFLNGKIFIGDCSLEGGRISESSSHFLSDQLKSLGVSTNRMKTGTPPRIDINSVDLTKLEIQEGDSEPEKFSFLDYHSPLQSGTPQMVCYIGHTNKTVHNILKEAFPLSPLFNGKIHGKGPRYCPSIEDKIRTFSGKDAHQLFLEPEGWFTKEYYLQGFSSSLPLTTQLSALSQVNGFEKVKIFRPAHAVEYDYFDPLMLNPSLESKVIPGLFLAGQVNGTTGYEEAAAQGLVAGINAFLKLNNSKPLILSRDSSYIGVLIDDLITKGVDEPYRMFTSRAEFRILLRQDNADVRLSEISHKIGLADEYRLHLLKRKSSRISKFVSILGSNNITPSQINPFLSSRGISEISYSHSASSLLTRPQISIKDLLPFVPRGTLNTFKRSIRNNSFKTSSSDALLIFHTLPYKIVDSSNSSFSSSDFFNEVLNSSEILIKYSGYIDREKKLVDKIKSLENIRIPSKFDYNKVSSLSYESRQKLILHKPLTIAQASRIPGVSPADISVLLIYFGR